MEEGKCCKGNCQCCGQSSCNCNCHQDECHDDCHESCHDEEMLWLELADEAWMEVLKEKIKEHIIANQSDRLNELAAIISDANNKRWKHKLEKKHCCDELKEKLHQFFKEDK